MATVEDILKQAGYTDEQIRSLDQRTITAFSGVLTEADSVRKQAQEAREAAELAQRSNVDFYENKIAPSLTNWEEEKQRIENRAARAAAEAAFYRTQAEEAKKSGFISGDAPSFDPSNIPPANGNGQPRNAQGQYVAGAPGGTPGSPQYQNFDVSKVYERAGDAVGILTDIQWEYQRLYDGKPMPISPTELVRRADSVKLDPRTYAAREFNFEVRRQQIADAERQKHEDAIRAEERAPWEQKVKDAEAAVKKAVDDTNRKWAEQVGSNPDVRLPQQSRYADMERGRRAGTVPDPLSMTDLERRQLTTKMIREEIAANQTT